MNVVLIDPITDSRWDEFVSRHPDRTIFHSSMWAEVLKARYHREPHYLALEDEQGMIRAVTPWFMVKGILTGKRYTCLPGSEYCFPLAGPDIDVTNLILAMKAKIDDNEASYLEIKGWQGATSPEQLGLQEYSYYLAHVLTMGTPEEMTARLTGKKGYNVRRAVKQAENSDIVIREATGEQDFKAFYRLTVSTRRKRNLLPEPYASLKAILDTIVLTGHGYLLVASLGDRVIAGGLCLCYGDTVLLKYQASDQKYLSLNANYLVTWKVIERAFLQGYKYFHFGRTHPENKGLVSFKRKWGSIESVLPYYYYPKAQGAASVTKTSPLYRAYTAGNKLLPVFAAKMIGNIVSRQLG